MTTKSYTTVKVDFSFADEMSDVAYKRIVKKVTTLRKNAEYDSAVAIFSDRFSLTAIITFHDIDHKIYDKMRSPLTRLIDSHKEPATFQWDNVVNEIN